jgi:hypothetical protein
MKPLMTKTRLSTALLAGTALALSGLPFLLGAVGVLLFSLLPTAKAVAANAPVLFDITITASDIIEEATEYFRNSGQTEDQIRTIIQDKRDLVDVSELRIVDGDIVELSEAEITDVIQTFKTQWSPKGAVTMTPVPFRLRNIKIDLDITPDKIKSTYYGFLAGMPAGDRKDWPIVRFIWERLVAPKWGANLSYTDWAGAYVAPTNDTTAGPTLGSYDGLKTIIEADLDGGTPKMTELSITKDLTDATEVFAGFEEAIDQLDQKYHSEDLVVLCSPKTELAYFRDRRNTHGNDADYAQKNRSTGMTIDGRENMRIQKMAGMGRASDHGWLVITTARNLLRGNRSNSYNMHMESAKRAVSVMADWYEGVGFGLAEEVFVVRPAAGSSN